MNIVVVFLGVMVMVVVWWNGSGGYGSAIMQLKWLWLRNGMGYGRGYSCMVVIMTGVWWHERDYGSCIGAIVEVMVESWWNGGGCGKGTF